jgi:hypothetical protein
MYNFKVTSDKDDSSSNRTSNSKSKPSDAPSSDKDFKKILSDKESQEDENNDNAKFMAGLDGTIEYEELVYEQEKATQQQPSLFDLSMASSKKNAAAGDVVKMASADELPVESPSSMFKNLALKEKAKKEGSLEQMNQALDDSDDDQGKVLSRFPQESIDLSYVNPLAINNATAAAVDDKVQQSLTSQRMTTQQLVDAIVKAITTVEAQGKTDTIVTLKQPPMFANANLILTSYESAKGEFNIRFENLTQQGKAFMDMQQNQNSLRFALQEKGYAVHIVTATTQIETPIAAAEQPTKDSNDQQQQQQGQQQQKRKSKDEEEA